MAAMNYSLNAGATWAPVPANNLVVNTTTNMYQITVPTGSPTNIYAAGQVLVQDANAPSVQASCGQWVVSPFNPQTSVTTGTLVFGFEAANPACVGLDANGNVSRLIDYGGSGQYLTIGPTAIPTALQPPPPLNTAVGAGVLGGTPVGPLAPYQHLSGSDNTRTLVKMATTVNSGGFDPGANFFDAGPVGGPNNAIIGLFNTSNLTTNSVTVVCAVYLNTNITNNSYQGGPIWGTFENQNPGNVNYISTLRWHSGGLEAQIYDYNNGGVIANTPNLAQSTSRWMVCTTVKNGATWQCRINQGAWQTVTITNTGTWSATNMSIGGSFTTGVNQQSGNSYSMYGDFYMYQGALGAADLANVEAMVGQSIGVSLTATAPTLSIWTPAWAYETSNVFIYGSYTGTPPTQVDYTSNGGSTWTTLSTGALYVNTATQLIDVNIGPQSAGVYAKGQFGIRYTSSPSVFVYAPGMSIISAFNPAAPSSGTLIFATQIAQSTSVGRDAQGRPAALLNYLGDGQFLYYGPTTPASTLNATYAYTGTPALSPAWDHANGADGGQTVLDMTSAPNNYTLPTTLYNFYDAGPLGGPNNALLDMCNTSAANTGSWFCVFACFIAPASNNLFQAGPIWIQYGTTAQTANYISVGRIHSGGFEAQYSVTNFGSTTAFDTANNSTFATGVWCTIATQKNGSTFQVRIRTSSSVPSWTTVTITGTGSTNAFTASNFAYGGGSPPNNNNLIIGNSYPYLGDMFVGTGTPDEADFEGYEVLAASSVGLNF
jgi:hypothetical protein